MKRLKGYKLLQHHFSQHDSKEEEVKGAGYTDGERIYYMQYYEALQPALRWYNAKINTIDDGGSKVTKNIVNACKNKLNYNRDNDEVFYYSKPNLTFVYYHGEKICMIYWTDEIIQLCDVYRSKSTKERLNRILMYFTGCKLFQKNREWFVYSPQEDKDIPFVKGLSINFIGDCPE